MTHTPDDSHLLRTFATTRSPEAFRQLVDRHLPAIHSAATRILRHTALAHHTDDITQSVFILLAQNAAKIPTSTPLIGWLYQVTHYACANLQKAERRRRQRETATMRPTNTTPPTITDAEALLDPALLTLSPHERNALLLRYTQNLPLAEIARLTQVPPTTAKKRLRRALQKLRHYFASQGMPAAAPLALHALTPTPSIAINSMVTTITTAALAPTTAATTTSLLIVKGVALMLHVSTTAKITFVTATVILLIIAGYFTNDLLTPRPVSPAPLTAVAPEVQRLEQQAAVETIQRLGGKVWYDYQRPDPKAPNRYDPQAAPKDPETFHPVVSVNLRDTQAVDDDLKVLVKFPQLENLDLTSTQITSAGLSHLGGLKHLRVLSLWKTQVDDEGLKHIEGLTSMWMLILDETNVTDAGLVHLKGMTGLEEWLGLANTRVTDDGIQYLQRFAKLRSLNLRQTDVTPLGVQQLQVALPATLISSGL